VTANGRRQRQRIHISIATTLGNGRLHNACRVSSTRSGVMKLEFLQVCGSMVAGSVYGYHFAFMTVDGPLVWVFPLRTDLTLTAGYVVSSFSSPQWLLDLFSLSHSTSPISSHLRPAMFMSINLYLVILVCRFFSSWCLILLRVPDIP
jgi:hypothetical protein